MKRLMAALLCLPWFAFANTISLEEFVSNPDRYGQVLLMRHALAPGNGDPANFDITRCETQRNLDERGREQSRQAGLALSSAGFSPKQVYSSAWCRCVETAELMALGPVQTHPGLYSFFQQHADRDETMAALEELLQSLGSEPTLMVTHFVVISALTGKGVSSGEFVAYNVDTRESWRVRI